MANKLLNESLFSNENKKNRLLEGSKFTTKEPTNNLVQESAFTPMNKYKDVIDPVEVKVRTEDEFGGVRGVLPPIPTRERADLETPYTPIQSKYREEIELTDVTDTSQLPDVEFLKGYEKPEQLEKRITGLEDSKELKNIQEEIRNITLKGEKATEQEIERAKSLGNLFMERQLDTQKSSFGFIQGVNPVPMQKSILKNVYNISENQLEEVEESGEFKKGKVAGKVLLNAGLYSALAPAFQGTAIGKKLASKVGTFTATQMADMALDTVIQTPQEVIESINNNDSLSEFGKKFAINRALDAVINLAIGGSIEGVKALKKYGQVLPENVKVQEALTSLDTKTGLEPTVGLRATQMEQVKPQNKIIEDSVFAGKNLDDTMKDFNNWRKANFDGAFGKLPDDDMMALKELYAEDTGIDLTDVIDEPRKQLTWDLETQSKEGKEINDLVNLKDNKIDTTRFKKYLEAAKKNEVKTDVNYIAEETKEILKRYNGVPVEELQATDVALLNRAKRQLEWASNNHNKLNSIQGTTEEIVDSITKELPTEQPIKLLGKANKKIRSMYLDSVGHMGLAKYIDPSQGKFYQLIDKADTVYFDKKIASDMRMKKAFDNNNVDLVAEIRHSKQNPDKIKTVLGGKELEVENGKELLLSLMVENPRVKSEILKSGIKITDANGIIQTITPTAKELDNLAIPEGKENVTKAIREFFDVGHTEASRIYKQINGVDLPKRDFYIPIVRAGGKPIKTSEDFFSNVMGASIFKTFEGDTNPIIIRNMWDTIEDYKRVVSNAQLEPYVRDIKKVVNDPQIQDALARSTGAVNDKGDSLVRSKLQEFLDDFTESNIIKQGTTEQEANKLVNKFLAANILYNPTTAVKQFMSYPMAANEVGAKYLIEGAATNNKATRQSLIDRFPEIKHRLEGKFSRETAALKEMDNPLLRVGGELNKKADFLTITSIYNGAERQIAATTDLIKGTPEFDTAVAELGRKALRTQPSYTPINRAKILRTRNPFLKLATGYTTAPLRQFEQISNATIGALNGVEGSKGELGKALATTGISIGLITAVDKTADRLKDSDSWDKKDESLTHEIGSRFTANAVGMIPVAGKLLSSYLRGFEISSMAYDNIQDISDGVGGAFKAIEEGVSPELDEAFVNGNISMEEYTERKGSLIAEVIIEAIDPVLKATKGISPKIAKRSADIGVGALEELGVVSPEARIGFQTFGDVPEDRAIFNELEFRQSIGDESMTDALMEEYDFRQQMTKSGSKFEDLEVYQPETRKFISNNLRKVNKDVKTKELEAIDYAVKNYDIDPETTMKIIEGASEYNNKGARMGYLLTREELQTNFNKTHIPIQIARILWGYENLDEYRGGIPDGK